MAALRDEWQAARMMRQEEMAQRRADVQVVLSNYQQVREQTADELRQMLAEHYAVVQDETNLYLAQVAQRRQAQAQRTAEMLQAFDAELQVTVALLREDNRQHLETVAQYVDELCLATQETLAGHTRDRAVMRSRQEQVLAEYVADLQDAVADYLDEVAENRQAAAVVDRAQRHRDREALTDEVQAMREDFAVYRQQMQAFRENLRQSVWGGDAPQVVAPKAPVKVPKAPSSMPAKATAPKAASNNGAAGTNGRKASATTSRRRAKAQPTAQPAKPAAVSAPDSKAAAKSEVPTEEAVFDYLQTHNEGARLTEIESTLGINRFQAVDALRSLIQKELIVQKDRTYRIQEEAVL